MRKRMEGGQEVRDVVKDAWVKKKMGEKKGKETGAESLGREDDIDLSCFTDSFPPNSFLLSHLT